MTLIGVSAVFVPFEKQGERWVKRDDLPRFLTSKEVVDYIATYGYRFSWRRNALGQNEFVRIDWQERSETDLIKEYAQGVGTPEFLRKNGRVR